MSGLFQELRRRNVVRVGVAYVVVGWIVTQIAQLLFEAFGTPDWVIKTVIVLVALGFPFALLFAWAFELTPDGLKKTREVDVQTSVTATTGRKLDFVIIGALVLALGYFIWERQTYDRAAPETVAADTGTDVAPAAESTTEERSIAVLPFVSMSSDEEQEYFADGLTEEILNSLAKTPDLLVAARTSSFAYKGSDMPIPEIAGELGVGHVLEGSVRRGGDTLRITAQLIRATDGFHVWSETFDRGTEDIIRVQEEIAVQIAEALETTMDPEALREMMRSGTTSVAAYNAYLEGIGALQAAFESGDRYVLLESRDALERAISLDPEFAEAHWRLSGFWYLQSQSNQMFNRLTELPQEEILARMNEAFDNAVRYERDEVSKLRYQATQAENNLDFQRAVELARRYVEQRPNDEQTASTYISFLRNLGLHDEVLKFVQNRYDSMALTPRAVNSYAQALRKPESTELMRKIGHEAISRFGSNVGVMYQVHRLLLWAGDIDGAARLLPRLRNSDLDEGNRLLVELRQACAENRDADALELLQRIETDFSDLLVIQWIARETVGRREEAGALFDVHDESGDFATISSYLTYPNFDVMRYPNFLRATRGQGLENRPVLEIPYACDLDAPSQAAMQSD